MKYFFLISPKLTALLTLIIVSQTAVAQIGLSPYSRFGIGELNTNHSPAYKTMGGASAALGDWNQLNIDNPASYAFLKQYRPVFEADFSAQFLTLTSNGSSTNQNGANIARFSLGLPISKRLGLGLGIMPYSTIGYDISATTTDANLGQVDYLYEGSGGLNKTYIGLGGFIIDKDSTQLSIGADAGFIFGRATQEERIEFPDDAAAVYTKTARDIRYNGFAFNTGIQFKHKLSKNINLRLGGNFSIQTSLNANKEEINTTYDRQFDERTIDTISFLSGVNGSVTIPMSYSSGIALDINKNLTISGQVKATDWASFDRSFDAGTTQRDSLASTTVYSLGARYRPFDIFTRENILQRTEYRIGVRYGNSSVKYNNTSLTDFGMSFGLGIPVARKKSPRENYKAATMIQLGIDYGTRGNNVSGGVQENVTTIYFGISIMPSSVADRWFRKRKIN